MLLGLSLLLLVVCPFTESVGNFDSFPRGGQDFELTVFLLLTLLSMSLLAALCGRGLAEHFGTDRLWEPHDFPSGKALAGEAGKGALLVWVPPKEPFSGGSVPLPLRI